MYRKLDVDSWQLIETEIKSRFRQYLQMENSSKNLVAVEELLIAVQISDDNDVVVVDAQGVIDLAPFNLTPEEIQKFQKILRSLNAQLAESFQEHFPITSVISEIRSK